MEEFLFSCGLCSGLFLSCLVLENPSVIKAYHSIYHLQEPVLFQVALCVLSAHLKVFFVFFYCLARPSGFLHLSVIDMDNIFLDSD